MDAAAEATKCILQIFEHGFSVGVVAGNQYEVSDRFDKLKVVGMPFKKRGKCCKPNLHYILVLSTSPLFHAGKFVSKLAYVREVKNYGKLFIYQDQTLFVAINIFQKTNNPFVGVIFKSAFLWLVQLFNIHAAIYITACMGIGVIWIVGKLPPLHLLSSRC